MTRKNKLIALIVYLLLLTLFMLGYRINRTAKVKRLRADLAGVAAEQEKARTAEADITRISRIIQSEANTPAFIEALYRIARESGLKQHEVATESNGNAGTGTARPGGTDGATPIVKQRLKISADGNYRNFAEYMRRLQNMEQFNRIIDFKLTPSAVELKGTMTVELYSIPVQK